MLLDTTVKNTNTKFNVLRFQTVGSNFSRRAYLTEIQCGHGDVPTIPYLSLVSSRKTDSEAEISMQEVSWGGGGVVGGAGSGEAGRLRNKGTVVQGKG